jgi:SET domain-containing protein
MGWDREWMDGSKKRRKKRVVELNTFSNKRIAPYEKTTTCHLYEESIFPPLCTITYIISPTLNTMPTLRRLV